MSAVEFVGASAFRDGGVDVLSARKSSVGGGHGAQVYRPASGNRRTRCGVGGRQPFGDFWVSNNTVGSRFGNSPCMNPIAGRGLESLVVQVVLVTVGSHGPEFPDLDPERWNDMNRIGTAWKLLATVGLVLLMLAGGSVGATAAPVTRQQAVNLVIERGLAQRGVPYSWGGGGITGPTLGTGDGATTVGFDASGLIQYVYAGVGAKLPRSSGAMYNVGQKVTPEQALPADLIFYGPEGSETVTMFLGNNQMLEVTDTGVTVSPVRTERMATHLIRVIA